MKRSKQERELTSEERDFVYSTRHCAGELNDILQGSRRKAQVNVRLYGESGISAMFRGIDSYAGMHEKLKVKSREGFERLCTKFADCEEVQDARDALDETEGNWKNFLANLDKELCNEDLKKPKIRHKYLFLDHQSLIDTQTNKAYDLKAYVERFTCVLIVLQPAFWSDATVRWRHSEMKKVKADLSQFNVGHVVITWGAANDVKNWSKHVSRLTKWPVLWDKTERFCSELGLHRGLQTVWTTEVLDFLGCQRAMHNVPVYLPPTGINWNECSQAGAELVVSIPVKWDAKSHKKSTTPEKTTPKSIAKVKQPTIDGSRKRAREASDDENSDSDNSSTDKNDSPDFEQEAACDAAARLKGQVKLCLFHRCAHLADFAPSGSVYQASLTAYARLHNTTEAAVMDLIRQNRRFSTAPESARLQYEATTGLYYDPETTLYYDSARGYFYDASAHTYYYWSQSEHRYIPANALIQAEMVAAHIAQTTAADAAAAREAAEREAARRAATQVAAQLAEIRASKDDYAAYAYATCVIPQQQEMDIFNRVATDGSMNTVYRNTTAAADHIEKSLKVWDEKIPEPLVPYADDFTGVSTFASQSNTPPPPGL